MAKRISKNKIQDTSSEKVLELKEEVINDAEDSKNHYKVSVNVNLLNRRKEPNTNAEIIERLKTGQILVIVDEQKDLKENIWGRISDGGWVALKFCSRV